jgi:hypothetical protein
MGSGASLPPPCARVATRLGVGVRMNTARIAVAMVRVG